MLICVRCGEAADGKHSFHDTNSINRCVYCHEDSVVDTQTLGDWVNNLYLHETDSEVDFKTWFRSKNIEY